MSNSTNVTVTNGADKTTFVIKNSENGKIIAFVNFSQYVDEAKASGLTAENMRAVIESSLIEKYIKSDSTDAFAGISL